MTNADQGGAAALEHTLGHVFNDKAFAQTWARLLPTDQEVLKALASEVTDLHSARTLLRIGMALGLEKQPDLFARMPRGPGGYGGLYLVDALSPRIDPRQGGIVEPDDPGQ